jgi:hypothetical protein
MVSLFKPKYLSFHGFAGIKGTGEGLMVKNICSSLLLLSGGFKMKNKNIF